MDIPEIVDHAWPLKFIYFARSNHPYTKMQLSNILEYSIMLTVCSAIVVARTSGFH